MNRCVLVGRPTQDPVLKYLPGGDTAVATFTIAVDRMFSKDKKKEADFIPIVVFGKSAESVSKFVAKGKLVAVSGRIQTRNYEAKDGTRKYVTEVVADEVKFLEWPNDKKSEKDNGYEDMQPIDDSEDIPF